MDCVGCVVDIVGLIVVVVYVVGVVGLSLLMCVEYLFLVGVVCFYFWGMV